MAAAGAPPSASMPTTAILGVLVHATDIGRATAAILDLAADTGPHLVFLRDVASLMLTVDSPSLRALHEKASLVLPDGWPLALAGRLDGHGKAVARIPGTDLVDAVCAAGLEIGLRHFLYGGKPGIAERMAANLRARHPGLVIGGACTPPMRDIDSTYRLDAESLDELKQVRAAEPDIIWVGLSSPKQEFWMAQALPHLGHGVCIGVGAAFDFQSGARRRAPLWMRKHGLEWLHRLCSEPRRLWRRYLILAPRFAWRFTAERLWGRRT